MTKKDKGSGWFGDHRRHVLAGKGVSTVLPDGRRLDVSKFVAGGTPASFVITEKGQGFPDVGDLVYDGENVFRVVSFDSDIMIHENRGRGNYIYATLEWYSHVSDLSNEEWDTILPLGVQKEN